ncbi:hypothetical protein CLOM_g6738 [Closterium sp. NIES-68]|nr:hypothetical protein CLOM_g6738 [Closterium sp. NIES-68]
MEDNASLGDSAQLPPPSPELLSSRAARSRLSRAGTAPQAERSSYAAMLSDLERIVTRFPSLPRGSTAVPPPPAQPQLQPQHLQHPQTPQPQQQEEEDEHMMQMMMMAFDDDASAAAAGGYARSSFQSNYVGAVGGSGDGGSSSKIRPLSVEPTRLGRDERSPRGGFGAITLDAAVRGSPAGNPRGGASPGDQSTDRATVRAAPTGCATDSATACAATCATAECFRGSDGMERMQLMASFMAAQAEDEEEGKGEEDEEGEGDEGEGEGEEGEGEKKGNERMKVDDGENEGGERVTGAESARARVVTAANAPTADGNAALVEGGKGRLATEGPWRLVTVVVLAMVILTVLGLMGGSGRGRQTSSRGR